MTRSLLVTDFDGTLTRHDFYALVTARLVPPDLPDHWAAYRAGTSTHVDALAAIFASITAESEEELLAVARDLELEPRLADLLPRLRADGWDVVIVSAGCDWYITRLLAEASVEVPVHANPGTFVPGGGLRMRRPDDGPYVSHELGIDKAAVVRDALAHHDRVAFAGDGFPDLEAAQLVPDDLRFARGDLAVALDDAGLGYRPFDRWSEVAETLLHLDDADRAT